MRGAEARREYLDWFMAPVTVAARDGCATRGFPRAAWKSSRNHRRRQAPRYRWRRSTSTGSNAGTANRAWRCSAGWTRPSRDYAVLAAHERQAGQHWYEILDRAEDTRQSLLRERDERDREREQFLRECEHLHLQREALQREIAGMHVHIHVLEQDLARARARIDELEASTSWRITAPLRRVGTALLRLRRQLGRRLRRARSRSSSSTTHRRNPSPRRWRR
jgi:hypothetical protein